MPPLRPHRLATLLLLLGVGCHGISVDSSHDPDTDFTKLKTYDWLPPTPQAFTAVSDEVLLRLIGAELEAKGFTRDTRQPDLLVSAHRSIEGSLNTKSSGYEFRDGRMRRYTLQEGTLVVDLVAAGTRAVAWRGTATGAFKFDSMPAERQERLTEILHDMFADFPPGR